MGERREYMVNLRGLLELPSTLLCAVWGCCCGDGETDRFKAEDF